MGASFKRVSVLHSLLLLLAAVLAVALCPIPAFADSGNDLIAGDALFETRADDDIASGESGTCTWRIDSEGTLVVSPSSGPVGELDSWYWDFNKQIYTTPWYTYREEITSARFEGTVKAVDCRGMFMNCTRLGSVDASGLDTSSAESMKQMFSGCTSLTSLDLTGIDTSNVVDMFGLFSGCTSLASLDLTGVDTSNAASMSQMFLKCSSLTFLDLSGFRTDEEELGISYMFAGCSSLETVYVGSGWTFGKGGKDRDFYHLHSGDMFTGCTSLVGGNGTTYNINVLDYRGAQIDTPGQSGYFTLASVDAPHAEISLPESSYTYEGSPFAPLPTVTLSGHALRLDEDYEVSYSDNVDAGKATVTVTGKGNYAGTKDVTFTILPVQLSEISIGTDSLTYNGVEQRPEVSVKAGRFDVPSDSCDIVYSDNVNVGTATVTVTGKGNFEGEKSASFTIEKASVSSAVVGGVSDKTFNGEPQYQTDLSVSVDGRLLTRGVDYTAAYSNNFNAGTATVTLTGIDNYEGVKSATFVIFPANLTSLILSQTSYTYDGKQKSPTVAVRRADGTVLKEGTDYDLSMPAGRTDVGSYTYTAKGKGNYTGSATTDMRIEPVELKSLTLSQTAYSYDGSQKAPAATVVSADGKRLKEGVDYSLTVPEGRTDAGSYTYTATGKGNYAGTKSATFTISRAKLASMTLSQSSYTYDGIQKNPAVVVRSADGITLRAGTDYDLSMPSGRIEPGSYTYTARGKGNCEGTVVAVMKVVGVSPVDGRGKSKAARLAGDMALDTMSAIVDAGSFPKGGMVVLATSEGYWDALTAAGVAGLASAPVLMTNGSSLSPQTKAQISKLKPKTIVICGGTAAVTKRVENDAKSVAGGAAVVRCAGQTATGTACEIFKNGKQFGAWSDAAFVCTNAGYWDALAAAPVSYARHMPIFLTEGASSISKETLNTMKAGGIKRVYVVGGEAAISPNVLRQIQDAGISVAGRLWGYTAIETSEAVAGFGVDTMKMSANNLGVATSGGYWDALAGAALCGRLGSVLVLVDGPSAHSIWEFVWSRSESIANVYVFGGTAAISKATENAAVRAAKYDHSSSSNKGPGTEYYIKGNISYSTGEKIYHLPGDKYYDNTEIDESAGERWFSSEFEAQAAGWRHTKL